MKEKHMKSMNPFNLALLAALLATSLSSCAPAQPSPTPVAPVAVPVGSPMPALTAEPVPTSPSPPVASPTPGATPTPAIPHPTPVPTPGEEGPLPGLVAEIDLGLPEGDGYWPKALALDEETGLLYALNYSYEGTDQGCVSVLNAKDELLDVIPLPWPSSGPLVVAAGRIYVSFEDEKHQDHLAVVDAVSHEVLATAPIEFLYYRQPMLVDPAADRLYVAFSDHLEVRSATDLTLLDSLSFETRLSLDEGSTLALDPRAGRLYLAQGSRLEVRDADTLELLGAFPGSDVVYYGLHLSADGKRLYACTREESLPFGTFRGDLLAFDAASGQLLAEWGPYEGKIVGWDEEMGRVYLTHSQGMKQWLTAVDMENGQPLAELTIGETYETLLWDSRRGRLHLTRKNRHSVTAVDLTALEVEAEVPVGIELKDLVVDSAAGRLYLSDSAGQVHVLDSATYDHLATLPGRGQITLDAAHQRLYVAEDYGEAVTVLDLETLAIAGTIPEGGYVSVDSARNRVFVGHYIGANGPQPGDEGVRVFDGATLEQMATVPQSGVPTYNPLADELYIVNMTAYIVNGETLQVTGDLTPDVTAANEQIPWCNGCPIVTAVRVYPEHNLLAVRLTTISAGKGPGYYPAPHFFDATTREMLPRPVTLEDTCLGELVVGPIDGHIYVSKEYARYQSFQNLVVYDTAGAVETYVDGIGHALPNPLTKQAYIPQGEDILVLDLNTLTPLGTLPPYCLHTLDFDSDRLYAMYGAVLTVLTSRGGWPPPASPPEPGDLAGHAIAAIYATDGTVFAAADGIYRSTDRGQSWVKLRGGLPRNGDYTGFDLAVSPAYATDHTLFAHAGFGETRGNGVYRSTDGGETWQPMWRGLTHLRVYDVVVSPAYATDSTALAYAYYSDLTQGELNGQSLFRSTDGGEHWALIAQKPPSGHALPQPRELLPLPEEPVQFQIAEYGKGIARSTDGGVTWETLSVFREPPAKWWAELRDIALSPTFAQDATVYALGGDALYRSTDGGTTWQRLQDERIGERDSGTYLRVLAVSPDHDGTHDLFLGSEDGDFLAVQPGKARWEETGALVPPAPTAAPTLAPAATLTPAATPASTPTPCP
ncbi:MAG TPA: hypothetical protein EYP49_11415, partial [Anaerolineae bacterium]|nr:hypothetical protein [Anaerolineae bacterium]